MVYRQTHALCDMIPAFFGSIGGRSNIGVRIGTTLNEKSKKYLNSQNPEWHLQIASFMQPTVQRPKDPLFTAINDKEKQQILTFKELE